MSLRFDLFPSGAPPADTDEILICRADPTSATGYSNYLLTWAELKATIVGGSAVWGGITGTLSDQTDLQTALNGKENTGVAAGLVAALAGSLGAVAFSNLFSDLSGIPATFTPSLHAASHENGGSDEIALDASQVTSGQFAMARLASGVPTGLKFVRDDGTLAVPAGGGGGGSITATTVTVTTPALETSVTVVDAAITPTNRINVTWGNCAQTDENHPGMGEVSFNAIAGTGDFLLEMFSTDKSKLFGAYKINYSIAA